MADKLTITEQLAIRKHPMLEAREQQIETNTLCLEGGSDYISSRLTKFGCEVSQEYEARKSQAYLTNYTKRISDKINQNLFQKAPKREGIDDTFEIDVSSSGDSFSIQDLVTECSDYLTSVGWCWVKVDRMAPLLDENGQQVEQTVAQKLERGDRVYLQAYSPLTVVDWEFDGNGKLLWVLTEQTQAIGQSPFEPRSEMLTRTLYMDGIATNFQVVENKQKKKDALQISQAPYSSDTPPFALLGKPSSEPINFDDLERIQASLLNLSSSYTYSLWRSHFSMLVLSESCVRNQMEAIQTQDSSQAVGLIISQGRALTENSEESNITRFISPSGGDLQIIPEHIEYLRNEMFNSVGLYIRQSGKQAESGDAKAWDYQSIAAWMAERAEVLEAFEKRIVNIAVQIDPSFSAYEPIYNKDFGVRNLKEEMETLILTNSFPLPQEAKKAIQATAMNVVSELPSSTINDEILEQVQEQIKTTEIEEVELPENN